ncbi:hypothetical protein HZA97_06580 [Candidatus Woesearchaeota archaeon]|nr:hypothetical protein [Candidatus Woesearchaeota archaeon]
MEDLYKESEQIIKGIQNVYKFRSRTRLMPDVRELLKNAEKFLERLESQNTNNLTSSEKIVFNEVKRQTSTEVEILKRDFSGTRFDYEVVFKVFSIPREDVDELKPWLDANIGKVKELIDSSFKNFGESGFKNDLSVDIPELAERAKKFAHQKINKYAFTIAELLDSVSKTGDLLRKLKVHPTTEERSYINYTFKRVGISIKDITEETEDGELILKEERLITLLGHECMGHGMNFVLSQDKNLPFVLRDDLASSLPTMESIAQHYANLIFEDLKNHCEVQEKLGLTERFEQIYKKHKEEELLIEFKNKRYYHALTILADKTLNTQQKIEKINQLSITEGRSVDPFFGLQVVMNHKNSYDDQGNLQLGVLRELIYCARPVKKSLEMISAQLGQDYYAQNRQEVDKMFLTGFYTSEGFVEKTQEFIREKRKA